MVSTKGVQDLRFEDREAYLRAAKFPCIKYCDMSAETFEEAKDACMIAVEKYPNEMEKCTQVIL